MANLFINHGRWRTENQQLVHRATGRAAGVGRRLRFERLETREMLATLYYDGEFVNLADVEDGPVGVQVHRVGSNGEINIAHSFGTLAEDNHEVKMKRISIIQPEGSNYLWDAWFRLGGETVTVVNPDSLPGNAVGPRIDLTTNMPFDSGTMGIAIPYGQNTTFDEAVLGNTFEAEFLDETTGDTLIVRALVTQFQGTKEIQLGQPWLSGDFNNDGSVDSADYVVWRKEGGTEVEFATWGSNFGSSIQGADSEREQAENGVPELSTRVLVGIGVAGLGVAGRRQTQRKNDQPRMETGRLNESHPCERETCYSRVTSASICLT